MKKHISFILFSSLLLLFSFTKPDPSYTLVVFEGSDWCSSCRKFDKNVLQDSMVVAFLEKNAIEVLKVDFPQRKKQDKKQVKLNEQIAQKYKFEGVFPTVVLASSSREQYYTYLQKSQGAEGLIRWIKQHIRLEDDRKNHP